MSICIKVMMIKLEQNVEDLKKEPLKDREMDQNKK